MKWRIVFKESRVPRLVYTEDPQERRRRLPYLTRNCNISKTVNLWTYFLPTRRRTEGVARPSRRLVLCTEHIQSPGTSRFVDRSENRPWVAYLRHIQPTFQGMKDTEVETKCYFRTFTDITTDTGTGTVRNPYLTTPLTFWLHRKNGVSDRGPEKRLSRKEGSRSERDLLYSRLERRFFYTPSWQVLSETTFVGFVGSVLLNHVVHRRVLCHEEPFLLLT